MVNAVTAEGAAITIAKDSTPGIGGFSRLSLPQGCQGGVYVSRKAIDFVCRGFTVPNEIKVPPFFIVSSDD